MFDYYKAGKEYLEKGKYRSALEFYMQGIAEKQKIKKNQIRDIYFGICKCYKGLKDYENAIQYLNKAIKLKYTYDYIYELACCYKEIKDYKKAYINFNLAWTMQEKIYTEDKCEKEINETLKLLTIK